MDIKQLLDKYLGIIIGALVALVLIALKCVYVIECIVLIVVCAWAGRYVQNNKSTVKTKLKSGIDKVFKDDEQ